MEPVNELEYICADCSGVNNSLFEFDEDKAYAAECVDTCILWNTITFYGVAKGLTDNQVERIRNGHYTKAVKLGQIFGCLILCREIIDQGEKPLIVCDDADGDLGYVMSALTEEQGPLNETEGEPIQDVYYIHEFTMEPDYNIDAIKGRILDALPDALLDIFHVRPTVIAFYPVPLEVEPDPDLVARKDVLKKIVADQFDTVRKKMNGMYSPEKNSDGHDDNERGNILKFADAYQLTDDEYNVAIDRSYSGTYPEKSKDKEEFAFYEANGFEEVGNSRLLCKSV